jgi:hypothetical protein
MFQAIARATVEGLSKNPDAPTNPAVSREVFANFLASLFAFMIAILLVSILGKYLWNEAVVELVSFARPARNIWQVLGLFLFIALFKC